MNYGLLQSLHAMPPKYPSCTLTPVHHKNICRICHASEPTNPYPERHHKYNGSKRLKACPNTVSITGWDSSTQYTTINKNVKRIYPSISAHEQRLQRIKKNQERLREIDTMSGTEYFERFKRKVGKVSSQSEISKGRRHRKHESSLKHGKHSAHSEIFCQRKRRRKLASAMKLCAIL